MKAPLLYRDLLDPAQSAAAGELLRQQSAAVPEAADPLALRIVVSLAAWLTTLFLLGFIFAAFEPREEGCLVLGLFLLGGALFVHRRALVNGMFWQQSVLVTVFAGHLLTLYGAASWLDMEPMLLRLAIVQSLLSLVAIRLYPVGLYRFSTLLLSVVFWILLSLENDTPSLYHAILLAQVSLLAALSLWRPHPGSFAYALALSTAGSIFFLDWTQSLLWREPFTAPPWPASLILGAFLAAVIWRCLPRTGRITPLVLPLAGLLLLSFLASPGLLLAIALLVLGRSLGNVHFSWIGYATLGAFLGFYYYALQTSLLEKSLALLASGFLCLLLASLAHRLGGCSREEVAP